MFLFTDTQIVQEDFVEDVSNILNTYEVPNLLQVRLTQAQQKSNRAPGCAWRQSVCLVCSWCCSQLRWGTELSVYLLWLLPYFDSAKPTYR